LIPQIETAIAPSIKEAVQELSKEQDTLLYCHSLSDNGNKQIPRYKKQ